MLGLFIACALLVASSLIARSADRDPPPKLCKAYGIVSTRKVEIDGRVFSIAPESEQVEYERGCSHIAGPVIFPDCAAWESLGLIDPRPIGQLGPFYTDGTCDGSGGGTRLATAPVEIIESQANPPG